MNRLAGETSPYLLQHASNPVDWRPWGDDAFAEARDRDVPVLLSVGYSACHWCHVMEHESFSNPAVAELMNRMFVNIKVDREERPDVDAVYMDAVVGMTGHGGWPMTVFLTPGGEPFYGGTYYPPQPRHGMPSFTQLLHAVGATWRERRGEVVEMAARMTEAMRRTAARSPSGDPLEPGLLDEAVATLQRVHDPRSGGFGGAPKFPPGPAIGFLLREHHRSGSVAALAMARTTLDGMALGGMYDVIGGGFHRYSVDGAWLVPHFEKMLYDNALLAVAYLEGWAVTGDPRYRAVAESTLDYMLRELATPEGGLASSQDADTLGIEGATFVWTPGQLREVLGETDGAAAAAYYGVTGAGTFEHGASVLRPSGEPPAGADRIAARLFEARAARPQPARDDKVIASWNGLALAALAQGAWRLERADLLAAARGLARFLTVDMSDGAGGILRTARAGVARIPGYLEDYASVAHGLLELHVATGDPDDLVAADRLAAEAARRFADSERGGFFFTAPDTQRLVVARKELDDNPTPSGSSLLATVLLRVGRLQGDAERERLAEQAIRLALPDMRRAPHGFGQLLQALGLHLSPAREVAVVGDPGDPATSALIDAARAGFHPTVVYAFGSGSGAPPVGLLAGRTPVDGRPAAYVCERFACRLPVTEPDALREAMAA